MRTFYAVHRSTPLLGATKESSLQKIRRVTCVNRLLEVGDPQGNGPTCDDYPAVFVPIDGVQYHLQQLVLFPWFTDEVPSSGENGWYTFPDPTSITTPATYCP